MTVSDDDVVEVFRSMREASQRKRARNRQFGPQLLRQAGIAFEEKNFGAHLVVTHPSGVYDYWPGTGLWSRRDAHLTYERGVRKLIDRLQAPPG